MRFTALCVLATIAAVASAGTVKWTGFAKDNQWTNPVNWNTDTVPGINDDVEIPEGIVQCTIATGVNSLTMGTHVTNPANLTLFNVFAITQQMTVSLNGNLFIASGATQVTGQVTIGGNLFFQAGTLSGEWVVTNRGAAWLNEAGLKALSGASFKSQGVLLLGGVLEMNQSSVFKVESASTIPNGLMIQDGDGTAVNFDATKGAITLSAGLLSVMAPATFSTFTIAPASNVSVFNTVTFGTAFHVPKNSFVNILGAAVVTMTAGVSGSGVLSSAGTSLTLGNVNMSGAVNCLGGNTIFSAATSTVGILTLMGGTTIANSGVTAAQLNLMGGIIVGQSPIVGTKVYAKTQGINIKAPIVVQSSASIDASLFNFGQEGSLKFASGSAVSVIGTLQLTGNPASSGVRNDGYVTASAKIATQNINVMGTGTIAVQSTLTVGTATLNQATVTLSSGAVFSGSNSFLNVPTVSAPTSVKAKIGDYSLVCTKSCNQVQTVSATAAPSSNFHFYGM